MPTRLIIAYVLILLLGAGLAFAIKWAVHNSPRQKMKRYYREKRQGTKL